MSIEQIQETLIIQETEQLLKQQQKIIQKSETIEKIKDLLGLIDDEETYFSKETGELLDSSGNHKYGGETLEDIENHFPRLYSSLKKTSNNILPILQAFNESNEKRLEQLEKITKKNRKKLYQTLLNISNIQGLAVQQQSLNNLTNLIINSPHQMISIAIKKAADIEETLRERYEGSEIISSQKAEEKIEEEKRGEQQKDLLNYYPKSVPESFHKKEIPEIQGSSSCQVFYYQEDYYDCVNDQTLLIDIRDNNIHFGEGVTIYTKEELIKIERIGAYAINNPNLAYHFMYNHHGLQHIGGISIDKNRKPTIHIFNTDNRLRYGTKYINKYNRQYREGSCLDNGDIYPEFIAKETATTMNEEYKMKRR